MSSPSMRCRTAAEAPRGLRGSSSEDESEEELGGRLEDALRRGEATRTGAFFGAGALGAALPFGLPRGRFTGTSCAGSGSSTDCAGGAGSSSALVDASSAFSGASIGSRFTSIYLMIFLINWLGGEKQLKTHVASVQINEVAERVSDCHINSG